MSTSTKKNERIKLLVSRDALLNHIAETEKKLTQRVRNAKQNDPYYQEQLIVKYLEFQDNLEELKKMVAEGKTSTSTVADTPVVTQNDQSLKHILTRLQSDASIPTSHAQPVDSPRRESGDNGFTAQQVTDELRILTSNFNNFLHQAGFI